MSRILRDLTAKWYFRYLKEVLTFFDILYNVFPWFSGKLITTLD